MFIFNTLHFICHHLHCFSSDFTWSHLCKLSLVIYYSFIVILVSYINNFVTVEWWVLLVKYTHLFDTSDSLCVIIVYYFHYLYDVLLLV